MSTEDTPGKRASRLMFPAKLAALGMWLLVNFVAVGTLIPFALKPGVEAGPMAPIVFTADALLVLAHVVNSRRK